MASCIPVALPRQGARGSHYPWQHLNFPPRLSKKLADGLSKIQIFCLFVLVRRADALPVAGKRMLHSPVWGARFLFELIAVIGLELGLLSSSSPLLQVRRPCLHVSLPASLLLGVQSRWRALLGFGLVPADRVLWSAVF